MAAFASLAGAWLRRGWRGARDPVPGVAVRGILPTNCDLMNAARCASTFGHADTGHLVRRIYLHAGGAVRGIRSPVGAVSGILPRTAI
jgi:nitrate/nitrite transporter NarK